MKVIRVATVFVLTVIVVFICYVNTAEAQKFVTKGLVSFWTFDQSHIAGNTLKDVFDKNNGIIEGDPQVVKGKIGDALEFDGKDDRVQVPHDPSIDFPNTPFSVELWFKGNPNTIAGDYRIFCKGFGGGHGKRYECEMESSVSFIVDDNVTKTDLKYPAGSGIISDGNWHHWVFVRDVDNNKLRTYLDGDEVATCDDMSKSGISCKDPLWFMSQDPNDPTADTTLRCPGIIDEFRIYNRALSKNEIQQNYKVTDNSSAVNTIGKFATLWGQLKSLR